MICLKEYQDEAIRELKVKANRILESKGNKSIVFKAPTGSGKTIMVAEFLKRFVEHRTDNKTFAFIWTAPRKLHDQSKKKLEKYFFESKSIRCSFFEDLTDKRIDSTEVLFLNWESIRRDDNIYIRDNEQDLNLSHIIENTVEDGHIIVLLIDESHFGASTEIANDLIAMFNPKLTVEISATPTIGGDEQVTVYREDVIRDGMIKKRIAINPEFKNIITGRSIDTTEVRTEIGETTNEFVIKVALKKREMLAETFKKIGSNVNPLMLIQLPDRRKGKIDLKDEIIGILKDNHSITVDNGKLAIHLSEDKENLENISRNDCDAEVMIFKQAIALGWDCPRASIIALFRDWHDNVFSIQTVGRILRMPELEHYDNDELNTGFVYTNLADISIHKDVGGEIFTIHESKRKEEYEEIKLLSVHSKRHREETRLAPLFIKKFLQAANELSLEKQINIDVSNIQRELITDGVIHDPDAEFNHRSGNREILTTHDGETVYRVQTDVEVQSLFDNFVIDSLSPLFPEERSIGRVKESIYRFFQTQFPTKFEYGGVNSQMVVIQKKNAQFFLDVINRAKELYFQNIEKGKKKIIVDENWEIPTIINYGETYSSKDYGLSIMQPFFENENSSNPEKEFAKFLERKGEEINWWFKNSEGYGTFFAIPYIENNEIKPFYVDWIVKYKDGRIGLFDTKAGIYAKEAKEKAEGLAQYIKEQNELGKNIFGGIVIFHNGSCRYSDNEVYEYNEHDLSDWKFL